MPTLRAGPTTCLLAYEWLRRLLDCHLKPTTSRVFSVCRPRAFSVLASSQNNASLEQRLNEHRPAFTSSSPSRPFRGILGMREGFPVSRSSAFQIFKHALHSSEDYFGQQTNAAAPSLPPPLRSHNYTGAPKPYKSLCRGRLCFGATGKKRVVLLACLLQTSKLGQRSRQSVIP